MSLKGQTINVALDPRGYKELWRLEAMHPTHFDLRNGHYTDAKRWEKRPGYKGAVILAELTEVESPPPPTEPPPVVVPPGESFIDRTCGFTCPLGQYAEAVYDGGTVPAGPAIRSTSDSTETSYTGLVALYVPDQTTIALVRYNAQSLTGLGTVVLAEEYTLQNGDVLKIAADEADPEVYSIFVNDVSIISTSIDNSVLSVTNPCVCFVVVGEVTEDLVPPASAGDPDVVITKSADQAKTSDTVLADDSELFFAVAASEKWVGHAVIQVTTASATPDIKMQFAGPAGSTGRYVETYNIFSDSALGSSNTFGMTTFAIFVFDFVIVNGATPGNLSFQWSQNTSSADATTVKAGSALYAFKEA